MKYLPGEITGTMSGSIGAKTASHNRSGAYFRTKVTPTNPNTIRQQTCRSNFGNAVNYWTSTLSDANRALWNAYAAAVPVTDKLGQEIYLTGQNMFIRHACLKYLLGGTPVADGPTIMNTGESVQSIAMTTAGTSATIGVDSGGTALSTTVSLGASSSDDGDILMFLGPNYASSRQFYKGPYQLASVEALAISTTDVDFDDAFTALLNANGDPVDGQIRPVRFVVVYDDGRVSQPYSILAPVDAEAP